MADGYPSRPLVQFRVIGEAWRQYKAHWFVWSLALLTVIICSALASSLVFALLDEGPLPSAWPYRLPLQSMVGVVPFLLASMVNAFLLGGMVRMASNQLRGRAPRIKDLWSVTDCWFDLLLAGLICGAATLLGNLSVPGRVFLIIPTLIVSGLLMLTIPLIVEGRLPATGAIMQSWSALKSQWLTATVFHLLLVVLALSGMLFFGIGVLATAPLYSLSLAILYRDLFSVSSLATWTTKPTPFSDF